MWSEGQPCSGPRSLGTGRPHCCAPRPRPKQCCSGREEASPVGFRFYDHGSSFYFWHSPTQCPVTAQLLIAAFFGKMLVSPLGLSSYPHEMHLAPKVSRGSHRRNIVFKQSEEGVGKGRVVGVMVFFLKVT